MASSTNPTGLKQKWLDVAFGNAKVDKACWKPKNGVAANRENIEAVYDYYGKLFLGDRRFEWAGMAKLIGASFYAGFLDIASFCRLLRFYEETFLVMQKKIFEDQATMHEAYLNRGLAAIDELFAARIIDSATGRAWQAIDNPSNEAEWRAGNEWLLYREQDDIIDYFYVAMQKRHGPEGAALIFLLTLLGTPSIPGAHAYPVVFPLTLAAAPFRVRTPLPCGGIAAFSDRWRLIERDTLPAYRRLLASREHARKLIETPIADRAGEFRLGRRWRSEIDSLLSRWTVRSGSPWKLGTDCQRDHAWPSSGPVVIDLRRRPLTLPGSASVRAWANPRRRPFGVQVRLPGRKEPYTGSAQLVKLYRSPGPPVPTRLTVKLAAMSFPTAQQALRQLARDLLFDEGEVAAWADEAGRPAELGHHYSTRIFRGESMGAVGVELQIEHHVAERDFVIDVLFSLEPNS